jgi:threonine synthase
MINKYAGEGGKNFVISSSGNAALAAAMYVNEYNKANTDKINLKIFIGKNIAQEKLSALIPLKNDGIIIELVSNPKQQAFQMDKSGQAKNLRQSTDDAALVGYEELALELNSIKNLSAVFIPTSSGTTAQGLYYGFQKLKQNPQIHIVQTSACHPIVSVIARSEATKQSPTTTSIASAIVDKVAHRKTAVAEAIKNSQGFGWIATDEEIQQAVNLVKQTENIDISPNSALSVAGLIHSINAGWKLNGPIVCLITGK